MFPARIQFGFLGLAAGLIAGCETAPRYAGEQGGSWEAVLPGPLVTASLGRSEAGDDAWYHTRLNGELAPDDGGVTTAMDEWPFPPRPSLEQPIYLRLRRSPESIIFYGSEAPSRHGSPWGRDYRGPRHSPYPERLWSPHDRW